MTERKRAIGIFSICLMIVIVACVYTYNSKNKQTKEISYTTMTVPFNETTGIIINETDVDSTTDNETEKIIETTSDTTKKVVKKAKKSTKSTTKKAAVTKKKKKSNKTTTKAKKGSAKTVNLGTFKLTAYCNCSKCCGKWAGGATASGAMPKANRTIAVDKRVIPLGTKVIINGKTYVAEDTGGAIKGKRIDIYFNSHKQAMNFGVKYAEVFKVK